MTPTIKQDATDPIAVEVLATEIVAIAQGIKKLRSSRLNDRALHLLIQHAAPTGPRYEKITVGQIKQVLAGIEALEAAYLKKRTP